MGSIVRLDAVRAEPMEDGFVVISESDGEIRKGHMSRAVLRGFCERTIRMLGEVERAEQGASLHPHTCPYADRRCEVVPH